MVKHTGRGACIWEGIWECEELSVCAYVYVTLFPD